jgi:hypothetical protein
MLSWISFLTLRRMMVHIASHAKSAMCGSTASALVFRNTKLSEKISTSSAKIVNDEKRKRLCQNFRH